MYRCLKREWEAMEEVENMDVMWKEHIKLVFDYFHERTPRSFVECREFSLVWNYKYSDLEFGRLQAKDLLQHLLASPLSNSHIDVIQGYRSVEVRPAGMSKGSYIDRSFPYPLSGYEWLMTKHVSQSCRLFV